MVTSAQELVSGIRAGKLEAIAEGEAVLETFESSGPTHVSYDEFQISAIKVALERQSERAKKSKKLFDNVPEGASLGLSNCMRSIVSWLECHSSENRHYSTNLRAVQLGLPILEEKAKDPSHRRRASIRRTCERAHRLLSA